MNLHCGSLAKMFTNLPHLPPPPRIKWMGHPLHTNRPSSVSFSLSKRGAVHCHHLLPSLSSTSTSIIRHGNLELYHTQTHIVIPAKHIKSHTVKPAQCNHPWDWLQMTTSSMWPHWTGKNTLHKYKYDRERVHLMGKGLH